MYKTNIVKAALYLRPPTRFRPHPARQPPSVRHYTLAIMYISMRLPRLIIRVCTCVHGVSWRGDARNGGR